VDPSCLDGFSPTRAIPILVGDSDDLSTHALAAAHDQEKPSWPAVTLSDINGIKFTGGSSGRPKAVMQSFRVVNTVIINIMTTFEFKSDECNLVAAPMAHGASMFMLPTLARGAKNIVSGTTKPEILADWIERFGVTCFWLPPTLLYSLLEVSGIETRDFSKLRHIIYGGASASPEKLRKAQRIFGPVVESTYGQTEAAIITALRGREMMDESLLTSVGQPMALTQVRIQDQDGNPLPAGEMGEIAVSGDVLMTGYLGMPEETSDALVGGWVRTGDVGYLDVGGNLFIKDRIRDVVISGGLNIYPSDIEAVLSRHEAVLDAVVFGVEDEKWGERLEAAVQLKPAAKTTPEDLVAFVRSFIGSVKAPKRVHLVAELPRSPVGKVLRREARAQFGNA
jgi:fatty-acyl-CoA synthase